MIDILSLLQYPATILTIASVFYTGSKIQNDRERGFIFGVIGCIIWIVWATSEVYINPSLNSPICIVIVNIILAIVSYRGVKNNVRSKPNIL